MSVTMNDMSLTPVALHSHCNPMQTVKGSCAINLSYHEQYTMLTTNLKKWVTSQNTNSDTVCAGIESSAECNATGVSGTANTRLMSELYVTYYDCKPFGSGENGDPYGGTHEIHFTFGDNKKYECSYKVELTERYGFRYQLTIDGLWFSTNYPIKKGTVSMTLEEVKKWTDVYKYIIEICKDYKICLQQFLLIVGIIGDCFYNI